MNKLRIVEIELFAYCNRKCKWCPNSFIDRVNNKSYLDDEVFESLIKELYENNYQGVFSFSRYNEPFADLDTLNKKISYIRQYFPTAKMVTNTNGDYITKEAIEKMLIDELSIMDYGNKGREWVLGRMNEFGLTDIKEYDNYFIGNYKDKKILYYYSWSKSANITDRGGSLKEYSKVIRKKECYEPMYFIGINYDGTVSPCCNVRNDIQSDYVLGDLHEQSLSEIINSSKRSKFVYNCMLGLFDESMPCYYCGNCGGRYTRDDGGILYA